MKYARNCKAILALSVISLYFGLDWYDALTDLFMMRMIDGVVQTVLEYLRSFSAML